MLPLTDGYLSSGQLVVWQSLVSRDFWLLNDITNFEIGERGERVTRNLIRQIHRIVSSLFLRWQPILPGRKMMEGGRVTAKNLLQVYKTTIKQFFLNGQRRPLFVYFFCFIMFFS